MLRGGPADNRFFLFRVVILKSFSLADRVDCEYYKALFHQIVNKGLVSLAPESDISMPNYIENCRSFPGNSVRDEQAAGDIEFRQRFKNDLLDPETVFPYYSGNLWIERRFFFKRPDDSVQDLFYFLLPFFPGSFRAQNRHFPVPPIETIKGLAVEIVNQHVFAVTPLDPPAEHIQIFLLGKRRGAGLGKKKGSEAEENEGQFYDTFHRSHENLPGEGCW